MYKDPIVEDVRKAREEYSAKFNHDLEAIYKDLKRQEKQSTREILSLPPKSALPEKPRSRS